MEDGIVLLYGKRGGFHYEFEKQHKILVYMYKALLCRQPQVISLSVHLTSLACRIFLSFWPRVPFHKGVYNDLESSSWDKGQASINMLFKSLKALSLATLMPSSEPMGFLFVTLLFKAVQRIETYGFRR